MHDGHGFNPLEPQSKIHRVLSSAVGSLRADVMAARIQSSSSVHPRVLCGKVKTTEERRWQRVMSVVKLPGGTDGGHVACLLSPPVMS